MIDYSQTTDEKLDQILELLEKDRRFNRYMLGFSLIRTVFLFLPLILLLVGAVYAYFHMDDFINIFADRVAFKIPSFSEALQGVQEYLPQ